MAERRGFAGWRSETVVAALVAGVAAAIVAVIGLLGGLRGGPDDRASATPRPSPEIEPEIFVNETMSAAGGPGKIIIRVVGAVISFRPGDRLYAIAKSPARWRWWISEPVTPLTGGGWVATIEADPMAGEQIIVAAVRVPAARYQEPAATLPRPPQGSAGGPAPGAPGGNTASSPPSATTARPSRPPPTTSPSPTRGLSRRELIEMELRARGADASPADVWSNSFVILAPSQ